MGCYFNQDGSYYEGDRQGSDTEVPQRPASTYTWDGSAWQPGPPVIPQIVTMRQARLALFKSSLLAQVDPIIDAMPSPNKEAARIEWDHSQTVERNRPLVAFLGASLGLTGAQLDQLFITAATL